MTRHLTHHPNAHDLLPIADRIWRQKYRLASLPGVAGEASIRDTWRRVAMAAASVEPGGAGAQAEWAARFEAGLADLTTLPAGRILAGAGTGRDVTLFNCFVMGRIEDDLSAIFDQVKEAALTLQRGGGIGHDFSSLRPRGALVASIGADASGPVSFMDVWDAMCRTIMSAGARRGAMMATLRCDHPDIEAFIAAKSDPARLRNFNLSVLVTDAFLAAVRGDQPFDLVFDGQIVRTVRARDIWDRLMRATYDYAEPGVIFIDRINRENTLGYCETIHATNPCGEQPLPYYGACLLGSINLARLVVDPFGTAAHLDEEKLAARVRLLVRLLDNVIDLSAYPLAAQREEALAKRRIGVGVTGLADALIMTGLRYGSAEAIARTEHWMTLVEHAAYGASSDLAAERGAFPLYDRDQLMARPCIERLPTELRDKIARSGLRNGCLTSIAPTGTISILAGSISSGIEPVFDFRYRRRMLEHDGSTIELDVEDYAHALFRARFGEDARLPSAFVTAGELTPAEHLAMQAAAQRHVDSSISKTINCPADLPFEAFRDIYLEADRLGLKGCTTFRPNAVTGSILIASSINPIAPEGDSRDDGREAPLAPIGGFAEPEPPSWTAGAVTPRAAIGTSSGAVQALASPEPCPRCGDAALVRSEGCWICPHCGLARCG